MNDKFFSLQIEKKKNIINSGYKVFALYPYKKASMSIIANEAYISKSLLFYYFKNKKEYYFFLYKHAIKIINSKSILKYQDEKIDLFDEISKIIKRKAEIMGKHPNIYEFMSRVYYENEESLQPELKMIRDHCLRTPFLQIRNNIDQDKFMDANDIEQLLNIIVWSAEGYLYKNAKLESMDINKIVEGYQAVLDSLKKYYYKGI